MTSGVWRLASVCVLCVLSFLVFCLFVFCRELVRLELYTFKILLYTVLIDGPARYLASATTYVPRVSRIHPQGSLNILLVQPVQPGYVACAKRVLIYPPPFPPYHAVFHCRFSRFLP